VNSVVSGGPHFHFHVTDKDLEVVFIPVLEVRDTFEEEAEDYDSDNDADKYEAGHQSVTGVHLMRWTAWKDIHS